MNKRILLVNPWIYDFKAYDSWVKPLGLLYIGSILKNYGYEVYLIDCIDRTDESLPEYSRKNNKSGSGQYYREEITAATAQAKNFNLCILNDLFQILLMK
ncbi:MAG: hypothetical protein HY934_07930 [Candidatus Firestonebacteria bacterium]|nr:hypothetical protein [Candidatus Firestonebacteria bacterium]